MAQGTKPAAATPTAPPNGDATAHAPPAGTTTTATTSSSTTTTTTTVNRKKQKRREKEAAKRAAEQQQKQAVGAPTKNGHPLPPSAKQPVAQHTTSARQHAPQYPDPEYDDDAPYDENGYYLEEEPEQYSQSYAGNGHYQHPSAYAPPPGAAAAGKKKKKRMPAPPQPPAHYMTPRPEHMSYNSSHVARSASQKDRIWNTTTQEERERIREFWLSLSEDERKSLVKIEKEAVLRKMKEQQKHSCSCSVCGRKRTAIEEELEVLYDAYYEELEHAPRARSIMTPHPPPGHYDDTDELSGEDEDDEDFSNSEISSDDDEYSEEERMPHPDTDFLRFGSSLQVKGGILTVADDLLKNDGKKFIEMMEQLAERRMQREEEAQYHGQSAMAAYRNQHAHNHAPPPEEDEFDDEDDDEEGYEDGEGDYEEEDEDEDEAMTEEQRMEEGRRMFQIFAARMFEQRVLQAYKEKVAAERQKRLLEELAEEDDKKEQKEAKKAKEAQKRKEKKDKAKQAKQAEKEKREAELAAKEEELRAAEAARQEEQRRKKEEQRKKKEASRKAQEEERQRKEAERLRRQQEERDRQQEAERKARELKAQEKKARDETKRKEREEREAKEKEAREKKAHDDKARKEREAAKAKADKERSQKEQQAVAAAQSAATPSKRPSQTVAPALPPQLLKQNSSTGYPSPHVTPAVPKAPTPQRPRQSSQQDSHGSSPKNTAPGTSSNSMSPLSQAQIPVIPKSILTKPPSQQPTPGPHTQPSSPMPPIGPPPGMSMPPGMGLGMNSMPPGLNGFPNQGMIPNMMGGSRMPMFPPQPGAQTFRPFPPPGMHGPGMMQMGRGFPPGMDAPPPVFAPPGFPGPTVPPYSMGLPTHSRHPSGSYDKPVTESPIAAPQANPIQRPTPIQRPSSVKPHDESGDVDDLADHLGSKALLDDEEDIPEYPEAGRRTSLQQHGSLRGTGAPLGFAFDTPGQPRPDLHAAFAGSASNSVWGTPPMPFPMPGNSGWGNSPTSSMFNSPFSSMMGMPRNTEQRGISENRLVWLRRIICTTCKMLTMRQPGTDGYADAGEVLNHVDSCRGPGEPRVSVEELKEACDIIGDNTNGGGNLDYKEVRPGQLSHVKFVEAGGPPPTLGEIGSPVPGHSIPISGFGAAGRPFPGLGQQGF